MSTTSGEALRLVGMGAILASAFIRAMTGEMGTPFWDVDPFIEDLPETALLPSIGFLLDAVVWLGAAAVIVGESLVGRRVMWRSGLLVGVGVGGVALHGLVLVPIGGAGLHGEFRSLITGSAWAAAMVGAWAMAHLARDPSVRRAAGTALLGFALLLAFVGAYEYFREHRITVKEFDFDPGRALAAQGLEPGSTPARTFERRLRQPEATGWFGLANVYGSFAAAGFVGWIGFVVACWRARRRRLAYVAAAAALVALMALAMSGSKGAIGAAILGTGLIGLGAAARFQGLLSRRGGLIGLGFVALPLAGVAVRGMVGERIGELSLLFRAQYAVAAARIFGEHPILGVGPAGFKVAYATAKVPINPEHVDSPHSILLDWASTLGAFGLAWAIVWLAWVVGLGRGLAEREGTLPDDKDRRARSVALLAILIAVLVAWRMDMAAAMREEMVVRALGALLWAGLLFVPFPVSRLSLAVAGLVMCAHMQIELTGVRTTSVLGAMLLIGVGVACSAKESTVPASRAGVLAIGGAVFSVAAAACLIGFGVLPALRWEARLRAARDLAGDASGQLVDPPDLVASADELVRAGEVVPSVVNPLYEAARLRVMLAQLRMAAGDVSGSSDDSAEAVELCRMTTDVYPGRSIPWSRLGGIHVARFALTGDERDLESSLEAWKAVARLDPHALAPAVQIWRLNRLLGNREAASDWGARALRLDEQLRLDPLVRLPNRLRNAIRGSVTPPRGDSEPE